MLSICIVNWNTRSYLRECLASIEQFPPDTDYEVVAVDNASADGSAEMVRLEFPAVVLIENNGNAGYAAANNQAMTASRGDWLLLLNPDVCLRPGTLTRALAFAGTAPRIGALGIKQIGTDGRTQKSLRSFPHPLPLLWEITGLSRIAPASKALGAYRMTWFDYEHAIEADQPMATFLLFPRRVYEEVGGLDPQFPIFFNDVDFCYRIIQAGWRIYYTPDAQITHYGGGATRRARRSDMARESKISLLRFYEKHYRKSLHPLLFSLIRSAISLSIVSQALRYGFLSRIMSRRMVF